MAISWVPQLPPGTGSSRSASTAGGMVSVAKRITFGGSAIPIIGRNLVWAKGMAAALWPSPSGPPAPSRVNRRRDALTIRVAWNDGDGLDEGVTAGMHVGADQILTSIALSSRQLMTRNEASGSAQCCRSLTRLSGSISLSGPELFGYGTRHLADETSWGSEDTRPRGPRDVE